MKSEIKTIYSGMKKGHKVAVSIAINEDIYSHVFAHGWDKIEDELIQKIFNKIKQHYFVNLIKEVLETEEEKEIFDEELLLKVRINASELALKTPTAKQIYHYMELSLAAGEIPQRIMSNKKIINETNRLFKMREEEEKLAELFKEKQEEEIICLQKKT